MARKGGWGHVPYQLLAAAQASVSAAPRTAGLGLCALACPVLSVSLQGKDHWFQLQ